MARLGIDLGGTNIVVGLVADDCSIKDRISCKTNSPVPKDKIFEVMEAINKAACEAPVKIGDILIENAANTGVPVVATKDVEKK